MSDSDSEDENVIRYGTPLDPFEEDEVPSKRKFQQQADQYAVDAHGRRRFHGAFTGGFSAGFGNTVGTQEGWTPSSFKSSRSEKAQASNQKPEDFMDDEDRSEFGIAPRNMQTSQEFSGQKRARPQGFHDGPIPGEPVLEQLVRAVHETAAVKMLRKMGWREGQGVGDRLTRAEKKKSKEQHKVYGCYVPPEMRQDSTQSSESSDSEFEYETLFAPDDYEPYALHKKSDRFGLGYKGLSRHSVLGNLGSAERSHLVMKEKGKKVSIRGQAFGVGAFEADDDDIYATEDMSHYDFALGNPTENTKPKKSAEKGSTVLDGFVKATKPLPSVPSYPPPALPRDFTPLAAGARRSRFEPTTAPQRDQGLGRHELTAEARGALLGEVPLPKTKEPETPTKTQENTITNLQTPKDAELSKLLNKNITFVSSNSETNSSPDFISIKDSGKELQPKIFKPFASDPLKQARYETYLRDKDSVMLERDRDADRLSEWERNREMVEFEQAAILYRPLSGAMGDRFTHASEPDDATNPLSAVAKSSVNYGLATPEQIEAAKMGAYGAVTRTEAAWRPEAVVCKRFNVPEPGGTRIEPKKDGKSNVSYSIFSYLESSVHDKESFTKEQGKFSGSKSLNFEHKTTTQNNNRERQTKDKTSNNIQTSDGASKQTSQIDVTNNISEVTPNKRMTVVDLFLKESEKDLQNKQQGIEVTETIEKFDKIDLYKAIFLSDSENEDLNEEINIIGQIDDDFVMKPKNVERNTSPPRGIFANIDFDEINAWRRPDKDDCKKTKSVKDSNKTNISTNNQRKEENVSHESKDKTEDSTNEPETYGPKIPESLQKRLHSSEVPEKDDFKPIFTKRTKLEEDSSSSSDSWVEVKSKSKKEKKKKSKKQKSKHKKSKHKKKH